MIQSVSIHNRCDVHVLRRESHRPFHNECFASLASEPINLFQIPATEGHIGIGRYVGFHKGSAEFVAYVDDDDYVIPGIFNKCYAVLDANPTAIGVVTNEAVLKDGTIYQTCGVSTRNGPYLMAKSMHHLKVFRRDLLLPFTTFMKDCPYRSEIILVFETIAAGYRYAHLNEVGYIWRHHENQTHKTTAITEPWKQRLNELLKRKTLTATDGT